MKQFLFGVVGVFCFSFLGVTNTAFAATNVSGIIAENTTWTASSSPYIATDKITVPVGVTLTIEKGVVVKLRTKGIQVDGALVAQGEGVAPVYFTAWNDDTVGGDSNVDGSATVPTPAVWQGIQFGTGAVGTFSNTEFRYTGFSSAGVSGVRLISTLHNLGGNVTVSNSKFKSGASCAVGQNAGKVTLSNSAIESMVCGVVAFGGEVVANSNTIQSSNTGLFVNGVTFLELKDNTFISTVTTADIDVGALTSFIHEGNTAQGGLFAGMIVRGVLLRDLRLTPDSMPYIISGNGGSRGLGGFSANTSGNLTIGRGSALTIDAGTVLKFTDTARLIVDGSLVADATMNNKIYATSLKDDTVGGDTNGDGGVTLPARGDWNQIQFNGGSRGELNHTILRYGGRTLSNTAAGSRANVYNNGGILNITNSELAFGGQYGLYHANGTSTANQSHIHDNSRYGVINTTQKNIDATNNFWDDATGPNHWITNPAGTGDAVSDKVLYAPWKTVLCFVNCNSSVLFLPGIQASLLYRKEADGGQDKIWDPLGNQDVVKLAMNTDGTSVNDVYTSAIMSSIPFGGTVYDSFGRLMVRLVADGIIAGWKPFAYDWRYGVTDIAENGTLYEEGVRDAISELEQLALTSRTGKVTIIGHSNGGLLAKALMTKLEQEGKTALVDKVVFLASPQLGTPKAIGTILHGYDQEKLGGWAIDDVVARDVIQNMPGAYGLVPTQKYFDAVTSAPVTFDTSVGTQGFRTAYGDTVDTEVELEQFMTGGGDGRTDAVTIDDALKVNSTMMSDALHEHRSVLDTWVAPAGVEVVEVVGLGLDTVKSFEYRGFAKKFCTSLVSCETRNIYKPVPIISQYGDQTVMGQSAEGYRGEKDKYFVDLNAIEDAGGNIKHHNITENSSIQKLIENILVGTTTNISYISTTVPSGYESNRIMFGAHSPVQLEVTNSQSKKVSFDRLGGATVPTEDIPGSTYLEVGDNKYIIVPDIGSYDVVLTGTGQGSLTFALDSLKGEIQTKAFSVAVATITASTTVKVSYQNDTISNLSVDTNNDGQTDILLSPQGVDITPQGATYATLKSAIESLTLSKLRKAPLLLLVATADALDKKSVSNPKLAPLELLTLNQLEALIVVYQKKGWISQADALLIINIIKKLK